ncbi:MAG: hypothetical protein AAF488_18350 [Planctomycetota bacterium]
MALLWWGALAFLLTIGLAWVFLPILGQPAPWRARIEGREARQILMREKAKALRLIKDLDHEFDAGTIDQVEYDRLRATAMQEIVIFNRRLDALKALEAEEGSSAAEGEEA